MIGVDYILLLRYGYPALMIALAIVTFVVMLWPPRKTVHRDKHTSD